MQIRPLSQNDTEQMLALMDEFWMKHDRGELLPPEIKEFIALKDPQAAMRADLERYLTLESFVAEENDELMGFVVGAVESRPERVLDKRGIVEELFVTERARNQKLGTKLMDKLMEVFRDRGCNVMSVEAYAMNPAAIGLYHKLGFIEESVALWRKV